MASVDTDLQGRIDRHGAAIAGLTARVDAILAAADELTQQALESLAAYRDAKWHAGQALNAASDEYRAAQEHLRKIDALLQDLAAIKADHVLLTHGINSLLAAGDGDAPDLCHQLADARRELQAVYARIEQAHADASLADEDEADEPV
jgi:hypothetical protein